jgi:hypothetical protein
MVEFILAAIHRQAHNSADIDWGWKRISRNEYETPSGTRARIVTHGDQLRGLPHGTVIYKAFGWWQLPEREVAMVEAMIQTGMLIDQPPTPPGRSE